MHQKHCIVYFSPAGSTRRVAERIHQSLVGHGCSPTLVDLSTRDGSVSATMEACLRQPSCLWLGSPVYCDHAVPPVTDLIEVLPSLSQGWAVPFVTWGGVTSGLALPELARQLRKKQFIPVGAAKVLAVHSSMWSSPQPLAAGHPNSEDLAQVDLLVDAVVANLAKDAVVPLDLAVLEYLSPWLQADAAGKSLAAAKAARPPLAAEEQRCVQCGLCAEVCPMAAITLEPFPLIAESCVLCMQCVRLCPEQAFPFNSEMVAAHVRDMAARSDEEKATKCFW